MSGAWLPMAAKVQSPPECFGKSWESTDPACVGGLDPAFKDDNGGHIREKCAYYDSCGARVQAKKMEATRPLVPVQNLTRPWMRPVGNPQPAPVSQPQQGMTPQMQQMVQQIAQLQAIIQRGAGQPAQGQIVGTPQMMPVNFHIPQYLTVREDRMPGESVFGMLGREIVRSMFKSVGHTAANFFDTTPLFWREPPKQ